MGRDTEYPLSEQLELNLARLLVAANIVQTQWGQKLVVSSGYRPGKYNTMAGGASKSAHLVCMAVDFFDKSGQLDKFLMANPEILEEAGLWMEHPDATPGWCHVDLKPRGNRIFRP